MLERHGMAASDFALPKVWLIVSLAMLFSLFLPFHGLQADIFEYRDKEGRRIFTNVCNEKQLKAGCKEITLKDRPPLSAEEEKNLRELFPQGGPIEQFIKESQEGPKKAARGRALRADMNQDGKVTIGDVPGWVAWTFYYPGEWIVHLLSHRYQKLAGFLELRPTTDDDMFASLLSASAWLLLVVLFIGLKRAAKKFRANRAHQSLVSKLTCR